ncbi:MAG: type II/IV secretion system protein [Armatimonadetes bacterium]|nr:type II/IV secretion system protein [Armatimonadota bacterium]
MIHDRTLAEILIDEGYVTSDQLEQILEGREDSTVSVGDLLERKKIITEKQKLKCVGLQMGVPFVDLSHIELDSAVVKTLPHAIACRCLAIPVERTEVAATVAMVRPTDIHAIDEISEALGVEVDPMLATEEDVRNAIFRVYGVYDELSEIVGEAAQDSDVEEVHVVTLEENEGVNVIDLAKGMDGAPIIKLANALLLRAINARASDIHIEPQQRKVRVRLRIDGLLQETMTIPRDLQHPLISRIKVMAGLDIAERRIPQDGRCTMHSQMGEFDFRISTFPSVFGEKIVIRVLNKNSASVSLLSLGMPQKAFDGFVSTLNEPQGLVIVSGPTGSGKTTTLYAALRHLNATTRSIVTIEDPVEYQLEGITQGNVNPRAGITFAVGLRSILRQDPDVIFVGEVRDHETATTAVEAALTGHLVLTSMHANDACSAVTRLVDIGIESYLLGSSLTCSVAQRLVRRNCPKCSDIYFPDPALLEKLGLPPSREYVQGTGCEHCTRTGFRGRVGIFEVVRTTPDIRRMISSGAKIDDIRRVASSLGAESLRADACRRVLDQETTVEEVLRVTAEQD